MPARPSRVVLDPSQLDLTFSDGAGRQRVHLGTRVLENRNGSAVVVVAFRDRARGALGPPEFRMLRLYKRDGVWRESQRFPLRLRQMEALGGLLAAFAEEAGALAVVR